VKARRRQNAIDNLNAVSKAASRSGARRDGRSQRDFESLKKSARHLLVRTPVLPQLRIAETHNIKAETANPHAGINAADEKSVADLLPATGETGIAETGRAGMGNFEVEKWIASSILRFTESRSICFRQFRLCVTTWCMQYITLQSILIGWLSTQEFC
jgi:hypothetical protein